MVLWPLHTFTAVFWGGMDVCGMVGVVVVVEGEGTTRKYRERTEVTSAWRWGDAKPKTDNCHDAFSAIIQLCIYAVYTELCSRTVHSEHMP